MFINEENYVDEAEKAIQRLSIKKNQRTGQAEQMVTTSKLRNLLSMSADIYNEVVAKQNDELDQEILGRIEYLRVRFVYEAGRDQKVGDFVRETKILDVLKKIQGSRKKYILFSRYMEALVAFHKFYNGKDI